MIYEIKTEDDYEDFNKDKKLFDLCYYSAQQKIMMIQTNDSKAGCIAIEDLVGLKTKMDSFLVEDSEHIKVNGVNENVVAKTCHGKCKDVLLNKKCFRHSMNKMQSKNYKIGT